MSTKVLHKSLSSIHILYNQALVGGLSDSFDPATRIGNLQLNVGSTCYLAPYENGKTDLQLETNPKLSVVGGRTFVGDTAALSAAATLTLEQMAARQPMVTGARALCRRERAVAIVAVPTCQPRPPIPAPPAPTAHDL